MKTVYAFYEVSYDTGIAKSHEIIVNTFFCVLFFSVCFHAVKGFRLEPT